MSSVAALGVVLAGGLSRRMEGPEKTLMPIDGKPLIAHVCDRLSRQLDTVVINANGAPDRFSFLALPVVADTIEGFAGPLAGALAAMEYTQKHHPDKTHILTVAADTPFFPLDLVARLTKAVSEKRGNEPISVARSDGNRHPTFACWPVALAADLRNFLVNESERKVMLFVQRYDLRWVDFECDEAGPDAFFNINTPADYTRARDMMEHR